MLCLYCYLSACFRRLGLGKIVVDMRSLRLIGNCDKYEMKPLLCFL